MARSPPANSIKLQSGPELLRGLVPDRATRVDTRVFSDEFDTV